MRAAALRNRLRSRKVQAWLAVVVLAAVGGIVAGVVASSGSGVRVSSRFVTGTPEHGKTVRLDTSLYLPASTPAPAVLLSQGFGGDKTSLDGTARSFAEHGYVALTYSARGFGRSGGLIHFASPDYEVRDGRKLLDYLAGLDVVSRVGGKPQLATAGASYGGALSLLIAAADPRVGAVAADITWHDLSAALFPNAAGAPPGVFKKLWAGQLFASALPETSLSGLPGSAPPVGPDRAPAQATGCGRFAPDVCAAYQASAARGLPTAAMDRLMRLASPASVIDALSAPTLLTQGEQDSLFPLSEAAANARQLAAHGTPVRVVWREGGHDTGGGGGVATSAAIGWFDDVFNGGGGAGVSKQQPFRFSEQAGVVSAATGDAAQQTLEADGYPGIAGAPEDTETVQVSGPPQVAIAPPDGSPAAITSVPGLSALGPLVTRALDLLPAAPGQTASFSSAKLPDSVLIVGQPTVRITVTARSSADAVLFAALRDLAPDGTEQVPAQLVSPVRLTGLRPGVPRTVTVRLPSIVRNVEAGHRLVLTVGTTDFGYALPANARTYLIGLAGGTAAVTIPTASGTPIDAGHPGAWLLVGALIALVIGLSVGAVLIRRRLVLKPDPELVDVPVSIRSLVKEYAGGYRAVDDVSIRVERGQVVGLLGPNGAGKTTVLRVLVGLITPTSGSVHVFGQPVVPGAPVLARVGAFIEGPGFLPHLTGRENLRLFWAATGRPEPDAEFDLALDIAGLGQSIDRRVRAYSHGMKQRLGIAQAMLGLPEVLVLDEPTNGLDPPQIAEMREVLQDYARTGRTVLVSSHLLAEVEQTCTHVVVMHKGRLIAAGPTAEIAGAGGVQLAVEDPDAAARVLADAGIIAELVPARRALEDVFLDLIGEAP
ncbi:MAG: type transport system ATP-binding protein [Pseudonocardiales bacterium]|nr:type transport system ATP-binding protein [Pseudonocardiales bacterium]